MLSNSHRDLTAPSLSCAVVVTSSTASRHATAYAVVTAGGGRGGATGVTSGRPWQGTFLSGQDSALAGSVAVLERSDAAGDFAAKRIDDQFMTTITPDPGDSRLHPPV